MVRYGYYSDKLPTAAKNLWDAPNVLLQKFPADEFMVTTKLTFKPNTKLENEKAGLVVMGFSYAGLALKSRKDGNLSRSYGVQGCSKT